MVALVEEETENKGGEEMEKDGVMRRVEAEDEEERKTRMRKRQGRRRSWRRRKRRSRRRKRRQATCVTHLTLAFMLTFINHAAHTRVWSSWWTSAFFTTNIINHKIKYSSQCYSAGGFIIPYFCRIKKRLILLFKHA